MKKAILATTVKWQGMSGVSVQLITSICLILASFTISANAAEPKIYQQDAIGNIQYHKPSHAIQKDGHIIETDTIGKATLANGW